MSINKEERQTVLNRIFSAQINSQVKDILLYLLDFLGAELDEMTPSDETNLRTTEDSTSSSNSTLTQVDELQFDVKEGEVYTFNGLLDYSGDIPATVSTIEVYSPSALGQLATEVAAITANTRFSNEVYGRFTYTTSGKIGIAFKAGGPLATTTLHKNSNLRVVKSSNAL